MTVKSLFFQVKLISYLCLSDFTLKASEPQQLQQESLKTDQVLLRGLDKITARVFNLEIKINETATLGTLDITPRFCQKSLPEDPPEAKAYLEIFERRQHNMPRVSLFSGWMFASSPAISALEHPVIDVWVISCTGKTVVATSSRSQEIGLSSSPDSKTSLEITSSVSPTLHGLKRGLNY